MQNASWPTRCRPYSLAFTGRQRLEWQEPAAALVWGETTSASRNVEIWTVSRARAAGPRPTQISWCPQEPAHGWTAGRRVRQMPQTWRRGRSKPTLPYQPVIKVALHSSGHASRPASLLLGHIWPDMLPRRALPDGRLTTLGATRTFTTGCYGVLPEIERYAEVGRKRDPIALLLEVIDFILAGSCGAHCSCGKRAYSIELKPELRVTASLVQECSRRFAGSRCPPAEIMPCTGAEKESVKSESHHVG